MNCIYKCPEKSRSVQSRRCVRKREADDEKLNGQQVWMLRGCFRRWELAEQEELGHSESRIPKYPACWKPGQLAGWTLSCACGLELNEDDSRQSSGFLWLPVHSLSGSWWGQPQDMTLRPEILPSFGSEPTLRTVGRKAVISASAREARWKAGGCAFLGDQGKKGPR